MVDPNYNGNYSGVVVSENVITGTGNSFINLGIGMGSQVWSNPHPLNNFGPTTVTNNVFKGNIGFSIVINGWEDGLTVCNCRTIFKIMAPLTPNYCCTMYIR